MTLITVSCQEENIPVDFDLNTKDIQIGADGGIRKIKIESEGSWIANPTVPWITVSPTNGIGTIECEVKIDDIVMPTNTDGKVRTSKIKVIREVPLEECGVYGKILAKKRGLK